MKLINVTTNMLDNIIKEINGEEPKFIFTDSSRVIEAPIKVKRTGMSKEENLVIKWMDQIIDIAKEYNDEETLDKIIAVCENIKIALEN